jgi:hypothetical protein
MLVAAALSAFVAAGAASRAAGAEVRAGAGAEVRAGAGASLRAHAAESLACGKTGTPCKTNSDCCSGNLSTDIYTACGGSGVYWFCSPSNSVCQINYCQTTS